MPAANPRRSNRKQPAAATSRPANGIVRARWQAFRQRFFRIDPADRDPVVLRHNRIYILPTGRGLALLGTLTMMLVTSLNYALSLGFAVTFLLTGVAAAALLHAFRNLAGLELRPLGGGEAFVGNALPFTLAVGGDAMPRRAIRLIAPGCAPLGVDLAGTGPASATLARVAEQRGPIALGRVTLSSDYPLGLWHAWAYVHFPLAGIVYPSPETGAPPLPAGSGGHASASSSRGDEAELAGLREFVPGDSMQRVAWKAVARGAGWYSKQFEGEGGGGPVELSWFALPPALGVEQRLQRLCAWILAAERSTLPFALRLPGLALPAGQGRAHRQAALRALALYEPQTR